MVKHTGLGLQQVLVRSLASTPAGERMQTLKGGVLYFAVVFGAGFVLGPIRILWVVPRLGLRIAELAGEPIMLVIIILAAREVVRRFAASSIVSRLPGIGVIALGLMI